jgi:hypothetical protein
MARWKVQVADVYTAVVEADTEDEARELAKDANEFDAYEEQRILAIERLGEE